MNTHQICHKINDEILQRVDRVGVGLLHIPARPHKSDNYEYMLAKDRLYESSYSRSGFMIPLMLSTGRFLSVAFRSLAFC